MNRLYEVLIRVPGQPEKRFVRPGDCARHVLQELGVQPTEVVRPDALRGVLNGTVYEVAQLGRKEGRA